MPSDPVPDARMRGQGVPFERVRRIALLSMPVSLAPPANGHGALRRHSVTTGYLVGTLDRFNNAKRAAERDRVKHAWGISELASRGIFMPRLAQ